MGWSWRVRALASSPSLSERSSRLASANEHDAVEPKPRGLVAVQVDVPRGGRKFPLLMIGAAAICLQPAGGRISNGWMLRSAASMQASRNTRTATLPCGCHALRDPGIRDDPWPHGVWLR